MYALNFIVTIYFFFLNKSKILKFQLKSDIKHKPMKSKDEMSVS